MSRVVFQSQVPVGTKRYVVEYYDTDRWRFQKDFRFLWRAKRTARYMSGLGVFDYRVVDTRG